MTYEEHLRTLLRPLGLYTLEGGASGAELTALGGALDGVNATLEELEEECVVGTAADYGLTEYEAILPPSPLHKNTATRRNAIRALLAIDDASFTTEELNAALAGCGLPAGVRETGEPFTVEVVFPGSKGMPVQYDEIKERIESILPCHLQVEYAIVYATWDEWEAALFTWAGAETDGVTWRGMEGYGSL